jgi:Bacterial Ig-like domain (group 2)
VKSLSSAFIAELTQPGVFPVFFLELAFENLTIYAWSGIGPITPAGPATNSLSTFPYGTTFTGLGWLGKISTIPQTIKVQAQNITLTLSGIPSELVTEAINQVRMNGTATVWFAFMNGEGALLSAIDPQQMFYGALDVPTLIDGADTCTLSITCENPLISLNLAPNRRFNDADQQAAFPGDLGFSFVDALENTDLFWPAPAPNSATYPNFLTITPNGGDVAVGGTLQLTVGMTYSDGSTYDYPGGGSGAHFTNLLASSNPAIATIDPATLIVTGVSPGECSIMARITFYQSSGGSSTPSVMYRAACGVIVHS